MLRDGAEAAAPQGGASPFGDYMLREWRLEADIGRE